MHSIQWFRRRHQKTAQAQYFKTREEIQQDHEIEEVFKKIDIDHSGRIDSKELKYMFLANGIRVSKEEVDTFFEVCKPGTKGSLSFQEFKNLQTNPAADELFRFFIMRAQKENEQNYGKGINNIYMPYNLSRLLEHMTVKQRRETVLQRIEQDRLNPDKVEDTIKNYIKLFIISRGALDSISND